MFRPIWSPSSAKILVSGKLQCLFILTWSNFSTPIPTPMYSFMLAVSHCDYLLSWFDSHFYSAYVLLCGAYF
jgi:hypothetical protein